jgi:hypothetical protein
MAAVSGKCSVCGMQVEVAVAGTFEGAGLAAPLCPACTDQQFLEGGGEILQLRQEPEGARFPLEKVTITAGAVAALAEAGEHAAIFLARHARGDWGATGHFDQIELTDDERRRGWEATDDPGKINKSNVRVVAGHDGQVRRTLASGPCPVVVPGCVHDLSAGVRRLGGGAAEYVRRTPRRFKESEPTGVGPAAKF